MPPSLDDAARVLTNYPPDWQATQIQPLGSAGGMSGAEFWRFSTPQGDFALRRWPIEHPAPDRLRFIHAVLLHAAAHGCDVLPLPVTTRSGETFVRHAGHLWELAPWMPGVADYERTPTIAKLRAAMRTLAEFHTAVEDFEQPAAPGHRSAVAGSTGGLNAVSRHSIRVKELSPSTQNALSDAISDTIWPDLSQLARNFMRLLPAAIPRAVAQLEPLKTRSLRLQPCIKDIWHDHVLFTGDAVTGIVDFGAVDFDTPATDISRLLSSLAALTPLPFREGQGEGSISLTTISEIWSTGVAAYCEVRDLSPNEAAAARALATSGAILAGCNWIRWIYADGRQFENQRRIIERFKRIVAAIASA